MPYPAFDTHAEIRKLQEAGCAEEQAEAMVDLVSRTPTDPQVFKRFDRIDARFDRIDTRIDGIDVRLDRIDARFDGIDARFERVDARFDRLEGRVDAIEANMVTKTEFAQEFAKLYKHLMFGGLGICAVTVTAFAAVVTLS